MATKKTTKKKATLKLKEGDRVIGVTHGFRSAGAVQEVGRVYAQVRFDNHSGWTRVAIKDLERLTEANEFSLGRLFWDPNDMRDRIGRPHSTLMWASGDGKTRLSLARVIKNDRDEYQWFLISGAGHGEERSESEAWVAAERASMAHHLGIGSTLERFLMMDWNRNRSRRSA